MDEYSLEEQYFNILGLCNDYTGIFTGCRRRPHFLWLRCRMDCRYNLQNASGGYFDHL